LKGFRGGIMVLRTKKGLFVQRKGREKKGRDLPDTTFKKTEYMRYRRFRGRGKKVIKENQTYTREGGNG